MFEFENKKISGNISKFHVIIRKTENFDVEGTLINDTYGFAIDFNGIRDMLCSLEELFDFIKFPQATHESRSFKEFVKSEGDSCPHGLRLPTLDEINKNNADLILHVQFRHYSTWQGTIKWNSENRTEKFRSQLEMIKLIAETIS